jgi:hypothetical protein
VRADEFISEKWSAKYKRSINCARPRGFSQRAHCAGRKKKTNEDAKPRLVRIHRFQVHPQDADLARQAGLQQDQYGNWILLQYDTSGATFNRRFAQAVRMFGQPQSQSVNEEQLDELTFKGSPCTKDCSGHRAGYEWWFRKGRTPNSWSQSFNNGAALAAAGK